MSEAIYHGNRLFPAQLALLESLLFTQLVLLFIGKQLLLFSTSIHTSGSHL